MTTAILLTALRNAEVLLSQRKWSERDAQVVETIRRVIKATEGKQ